MGEEPWGWARVLGGNALLYPTLQPPPFVSTSLGVFETIERGTVNNYPIARRTFDLELIAFRQNLNFSLRLFDLLALEVSGTAGAEIGTNARALLLLGRGLDMDGRAGIAVRPFRSDKLGTEFAVRGFYVRTWHRRISFRSLIDVARANPNADLNQILESDTGRGVLIPSSSYGFGGSISAVKTLGPLFAVTATGEYVRQFFTDDVYDSTTRTTTVTNPTAWTGRVGGAVMFDAQRLSVPIGVQVEYLYTFGHNGSESALEPDPNIHQVAAGLFYTGRLDLQVGLVLDTSFYASGLSSPLRPSVESDAPRATGGRLFLRYTW